MSQSVKQAAPVTYVTLTELGQVQAMLQGGQGEVAAAKRRKDKLLKHQICKQRAGKWTNTIANSIKKEKQERLDALAEAERIACLGDDAHNEMLAQQRIETIKRANEQIRRQGDQQKSFESAMMLCDVLAERQAQIQLREEINRMANVKNARYLEMDRQNARKMLEREQREARELGEKQAACTKAISQQIERNRQKTLQRIQDEVAVGQVLQRKAAKDAQEAREAEDRRKQKEVAALMTSMKCNEYLRTCKEQDAMREQAEQVKIAEYAAHKEKMQKLTKERAAAIQQRKLDAQNRMIAVAEKQLAEMMGNVEEREEQQARDAEANQRALEKAKADKLAKYKKDCEEHRIESNRQKALAVEADLLQEVKDVAEAKAKAAKNEAESKAEADRQKQRCRSLAQDQRKQAEARNRAMKQQKLLEVQQVSVAFEAQQTQNVEFMYFAEGKVKEYASEGKNVMPMIKALANSV